MLRLCSGGRLDLANLKKFWTFLLSRVGKTSREVVQFSFILMMLILGVHGSSLQVVSTKRTFDIDALGICLALAGPLPV